jgi:thaumarchaeosortase
MILDYLNIESFYLFNERFLFNETWKGRMFYLFFIWLLFLESIIDFDKIADKRPRNLFRILAFFICANIPLIYVLVVNFFGVNTNIIELGRIIGIRWDPNNYFLFLAWPLSFEYLVFFMSFLIAVFLAYKTDGLKTFSISLCLLGVMSFVYLIDTYYPEGVFKPLQMLALPAAACAAGLLEMLGYNLTLRYDTGPGSLPTIYVPRYPLNGVGIVWSCAGVHSMLLYVLIIALLFKRSNISGFRKLAYFVIGAVCTYFVNILRIASYFVIRASSGQSAAQYFHDSIGELFFLFWIFAYILIIISVERFMLVEKTRRTIRRGFSCLGTLKK